MKTFLEEYGVIIVASIAILALVGIATTASGLLETGIISVITSFTNAAASAS